MTNPKNSNPKKSANPKGTAGTAPPLSDGLSSATANLRITRSRSTPASTENETAPIVQTLLNDGNDGHETDPRNTPAAMNEDPPSTSTGTSTAAITAANRLREEQIQEQLRQQLLASDALLQETDARLNRGPEDMDIDDDSSLAWKEKLRLQDAEIQKYKLMALEAENRELKIRMEMTPAAPRRNRSRSNSAEEQRARRATARRSQMNDAREALEDFNGGTDPVAVERFCKNVNGYAKVCELSDEQIVDTFERRMKKAAHVWWSYFTKTSLPAIRERHPGQTWEQVEIAFRQKFTPKEYDINLLGRFHELNLDQGLGAYIKACKIFVQKAPQTAEEERWKALMFKIDMAAKHHLSTKGITSFIPALDALDEYAIGIEKDQRSLANRNGKRVQTNAISTSADAKRPRLDSNRNVKADKAKFAHVVVTMANYNNFEALPCMTANLAAFLELHSGCKYCRKLNVPAEHTVDFCLAERRKGKNKSKDFRQGPRA